jgi:hypothetical protein
MARERNDGHAARQGAQRPKVRRLPRERHLRIGVSHVSNDPARHRTFELRAAYDVERGGWVAWVGEQNLNDQPGAWRPVAGDGAAPVFASAALCLGHAVAAIVADVDKDADDRP